MADEDFSKLLQQAEQLTTDIEGNEELPRVERSLGQVLEASQELYSRVIQSGANDIQAHLLFGSKGIDLQQISQKLETLSSKRTFEPLQPIADSDIESFLRNERENAILSLIDEVNKNSLQTTEDQKWEHMLSEWNREKIKLMNAMIGPSQNWLDLKRTPEPPSLADAPKKFGHSMLDDIEAAYARQVRQYNKLVFQGAKSKTPLHQKFAQVAEEFNDPKVKEMWDIISAMTGIGALVRDEDPLRARGQPGGAVQRCLVVQGRSYLEKRYKAYMSDVVRANPLGAGGAGAARGGQPGTYPLVRAFVGLRLGGGGGAGAAAAGGALADGCVDERPLWPLVYYCLRSGDPAAALHCLRKAGRDHEEFIAALEEYAGGGGGAALSEALHTALSFQYRIQVRNCTDPYKRAVYCVVGGLEPCEEHPEVARTADDYLWLRLALLRGGGAGAAGAGGGAYADLQKLILEEYGETHYRAYEKPLVYFQALALTGQFEPALEFLSRIPRYQCHGVHMALALHDVYMLGTPRNVQAPVMSVDTDDPAPLRRLNVARLVMQYARRFELSDPADALHYYYCLRNLKEPGGRNLFMACCAELALESRDYELLFGRELPPPPAPGLLHQFHAPNIDSKVIAVYVAEQLVHKGLFEDAITVYDIAGNLEKVLELFCVLLSQVVCGGGGGGGAGGLRQRLQALAERVDRRLASGGAGGAAAGSGAGGLPAALLEAYHKLCKLCAFFDHFHNENYDAALETLRECELVPLQPSELPARVTGARAARGELLRALPAVLRALCSILLAQRARLRQGPQPHAGSDTKQVEWLRSQAETLNTFAGTIAYRMPGDTYSQLAQMQILMH